MILRRLAQSLKEQNWTAITIEFVLLVAGVFLGMQVTNWNEDLAKQRLGREYVVRLTADLERNLAGQRALGAYYAVVLASVERADALLADPGSDPKALVVDAYRATEINYKATYRATWDEIVSSGDTGLLPREAAGQAAEFFAFDVARDVLETLGASAYRHRVRTVIPLEMQKALRAACSDVRDAKQVITGFAEDCALAVAPDLLSSTAAALRADPSVRAELRHQYSDVYSATANLQGRVAVLERALAGFRKGLAPDGTGRP